MTTTRPDLQEKAIPKKIHFIWVGGLIPEKYLETIEKLAEIAKRDGFELNVWVDNDDNILKTLNKKHFQKSEERMKKSSIVDYDLPAPRFRIRQIDELLDRMETDKFYSENKTAKKTFTRFLRSEMVGLKNLGAAADMLRYEMLRQEGGTYLDADTKLFIDQESKLKQESSLLGFRANVRARREGMEKEGGDFIIPNFNKMDKSILQMPAGIDSSRVWLDPEGRVTPEILKNEGKEDDEVQFHGGNDILSSIPDHPILHTLLLGMLNSYQKRETLPASEREKEYMRLNKHRQHQLPVTQLDSKRAPVGKDVKQYPGRFLYTLTTTGPALLQAAMGSYFKEQPNHSLDALFSLQLESRYLGSASIEKLKNKQIGIEVQSRSDKNWLQKSKKIPSFTTERMSDTIFAQRSNKKSKIKSAKTPPHHKSNKKKI